MTYRYARDRAMTLLEGGAYIERRTKASPKSKAETQDVYYLVWNQPQDNAGLCEVHERRIWRGTFFALLEDKVIKPVPPPQKQRRSSEYIDITFSVEPTRWVLNK